MNKEDMIVSIISILVLLIFVFNPIFRKILIKVDKNLNESPPREDPSYESADSYARRILDNHNRNSMILDSRDFNNRNINNRNFIRSNEIKEIRIIQPEMPDVHVKKEKTDRKSVLNKIETQKTLKKAIIWKEILSPPLALRDSDHLF